MKLAGVHLSDNRVWLLQAGYMETVYFSLDSLITEDNFFSARQFPE